MRSIIRWYYKKASIRTKLVLSYLVLVFLPIIILGVYSYYVARSSLLEQTRQTLQSNVESIVYNLNSNIQREDDNIRYLSYNSSFRAKVRAGDDNIVALVSELNSTVEPTLWYFLTSDENLKSVDIYAEGLIHSVGSFLNPIEQFEACEWYEANKYDFTTHWFSENGRIYTTRVLLDAETSSEPIGIICLEVYPERFIDAAYQSGFYNNGIILIDDNGQILAESSVDNAKIREHVEQMLEEVGWEATEGIAEDEKCLMMVKELINGWNYIYYIDKGEITPGLNSILIRTVQIMVICLAAVLVLVELISRILSRRILRLKECADEVGRGNFLFTADAEAEDEIGSVETAFVNMGQQIHGMMDEMYELGLAKRQEELKALQAMINPHFLYNCLSSIKWKAIRADQDEIADLTGLLAKFYRTSLNGGRQITTVASELDNVQAYLELQLRAHDYNFEVEYNLQEEGLDCPMPNFLLQPIVENAVCHGAECCEPSEKGFVQVCFEHTQASLIFSVINNGPGMDRDRIDALLNTPGKGYGLYNIQERIHLFYSDASCGVFGDVLPNGMVRFRVILKDRV